MTMAMTASRPHGHKSMRLARRGRGAPVLARCRAGATALEFALVAPLFLYLMMGAAELALVFAAQLLLDNATHDAARTGRTGFVATDSTQDATVKAIISDQAGLLMDADAIAIASKSYSGFDTLGTAEPFVDANGNGVRDDGENFTDVNGNGAYDTDQGTDGYGGAGEVVLYTVSYQWKLVTPLIGAVIGTDGAVTLASTAIVQNEPE